jgi:hypothetical protein
MSANQYNMYIYIQDLNFTYSLHINLSNLFQKNILKSNIICCENSNHQELKEESSDIKTNTLLHHI